MNTPRPLSAVLLAAAAAFSSAPAVPALAQVRHVQPGMVAPAQSPFATQGDLPIVTFTFDGGTLRAFVDAIKQQCPTVDLNVGFRGDADRVQMPAITMKGVSVGTAMQAMNTLADAGPGRFVSVTPVQERNGAPLYSVETRNLSEITPSMTPRDQVSTKVFSLRELVRSSASDPSAPQQTAELVLSVLEAAMEVEASESRTPPTLRYHKDSAMLIARGTSNQLQVIESVLVTMQRDAHLNSDQPNYTMIQALANAEAEVSLARAALEHKNQELEAIRARLEKISKLQDAGAVSDAEKAAALEDLRKANYEFEKARIQLNLTEQILNTMKQTGKPLPKKPNAPEGRGNPAPQPAKPAVPAPGK